MFISLKRVIKSAWVNLKRNSGLSFATIFILILAVGLITSLFLLHHISQFLLFSIENKVDISVYFKDIIPEEEILDIKEEISKLSEVKEVGYVSQKEAVQKLIERKPELTESIKETEGVLNIASLNIKVYTADQFSAVVNFLEKSSFAEKIEVDYYERKPIIERIFTLTSNINKIGIISSIILGIVAFLVAFTQIKLAILYSKDEIAIQRLVGASNWFIRGPFLVQGFIAGIIAVFISFSLFFAILNFLGPKAEILFPGLNLFELFISKIYTIILIQLGTGVGLGIVSSFIAVRKHLQI